MPKTQPLEYQSAEPTFIRRLKANHQALDGRHNVQIPRVRGGMGGANDRLNMRGEDGDDEPVMVDEDGNVVSREEVEGMKKMEGKRDVEERVDGKIDDKKERGEAVGRRTDDDGKVTSGFGRKRKAVKVVAGEAGDDVDVGEKEKNTKTDEQVKSLKESTKDLKSVVAKGKEEAKREELGKKTKRKKIKLSFDEPE